MPAVADVLRPDVDHRDLQALLVPAPGMAIEDSVVLAEELSRHDSVEPALEAFMQRRFDRCRLVVETSWQLSEWEVEPPADRTRSQQLIGRALAALAQPL